MGHGSHVNADSARPVYTQLGHLAKRNLFHELWPAFWKEEPSLDTALRLPHRNNTVIVPLFISQGYFVERVLPRELGFNPDHDPWSITHTRKDNPLARIVYARPVGTHTLMHKVVLARLKAALGRLNKTPDEPHTLLIIGHGTTRHAQSSASIMDCARALKAPCRQVLTAFLDQTPRIDDPDLLSESVHEHIIIVPFFISEGLHTKEDIPKALGLDPERMHEPQHINTHTVVYTQAVGSDSATSDIIVARAIEAIELVQELKTPHAPHNQEHVLVTPNTMAHAQALETFHKERTLGLLRIKPVDSGWSIVHIQDDDARLDHNLVVIQGRKELWHWLSSHHLPLRSTQHFPRGIKFMCNHTQELFMMLDLLYPDAIRTCYEHTQGAHHVESWASVASRQTGRYAHVQDATAATLEDAMSTCCHNSCIKHPVWSDAHNASSDASLDAQHISKTCFCSRPCGHFIAKVHQLLST